MVNAASKNSFNFFSNPFALEATISVADEDICIDETTTITFTASEGTAPYDFTYQINNITQPLIRSGSNNQASVTFDDSNITGDYTIKLIKVEDAEDVTQNITNQEIIVTVHAPPTVAFSFNNNDNNACAGDTVQFTSTESGNGEFTYLWDFGDGTTSTQKNPGHQFNTALGCGQRDFEVQLTVTDKFGCSASTSNRVRVIEKPDIVIFDLNDRDFSNCNRTTPEPNYVIDVGLDATTSDCADEFLVIWGDGNQENVTRGSFPLTHEYTELGVYDLIVRSTSSNGCTNQIIKEVKNISNPSGSLVNPGSTQNICTPTNSIEFSISKWGVNSLDTEYFIDYGDGNTLYLTQEDLINSNLNLYNASDPESSPNFPVPHIYEESSCPSTFTASLDVVNACSSTKSFLTEIRIIDKPKLDFEIPESACANSSISFQNKSVYGSGSNCSQSGRFTWDFGDGTTTPSTTQITSPNHIYASPGNYTITLSATSFCGAIEITKEICIEPEVTAQFTVDNEEGCIPLNIAATNTTIETELCDIPQYRWAVVYNADNCGDTSDWEFANGTTEASENPEFLFKNPGKYSITQTVITSCGSETNTKVIDVKKPPTVGITAIDNFCGSATINPVATVENCTSDTSGISYNWTFTGGNPSTANTLDPGNIVYDTPGIYEVNLEVTNECGISNTATQSFEVFEKPEITNTDTTQEICSGQNTAEIVFDTTNANTTYTWSAVSSGNITGFTANGTTNSIPSERLINSGGNSETLTYTVIPTSGICEGDPFDFVITVNPAPIITTQPTSSEICLNGVATILEVEFTNTTETPNYQWYTNTSNANTGGNPITDATENSYNPPTDTVGETFYYAEITFSSGGCDKIVSNVATVTVTEQLTITSTPQPQTICIGGTVNTFEITSTGGTGTPIYQWYSNTTNSNTGGNLIDDAVNSTYTPPVFSTAGSFYYYVEVSPDGNGCTTASSDVFEVTVVPKPTIDAQPIVSQELCQNATPDNLVITVSGGSSSAQEYQWYVNTVNSNTGGTLVNGANSENYTPPTNQIGTFYYYAIITQPESGCTITSDISTLIINEAPIFTTQPISSEICINGNANLLEVDYTNGTGAPTYQWFSNTTNSNLGGTIIVDETSSTYNPPTDTVGEQFYYAEISFEAGGGCDKITSEVASVNVVEQLSVNPVDAPQNLCLGGTADALEVTFTGGTGAATYQWFSNTSDSNTGGNLIGGATDSNYTPPTFSVDGTFYYYAEVSLNGDGCTNATSDTFKINVVPKPIIDAQPIAAQELCQGAISTNLAVTASGGSTSAQTYQWFLNNTNSNSGGSPINGANASTYTPSTDTVGTFYYYVVVSQPESGCSIISEVSTLKINEGPDFTIQPTPSEVCLNDTATTLEVAYENGTGTATYQWFSSDIDSNSNGDEIPGENNATYNPPTDTVGEIFYYAVISFSGGGCSEIVSETARVKVNGIPVVANNEIAMYSEATFTFDPNSIATNTIPAGTQYTWSTPTFSPAGSILGASAATTPQNTISQTLENTGTSPIIVTYVITPATASCVGNPFTLEVTVNPNISSNTVVTNITCFEANDGAISTNIQGGVPSSTGNPYQISWSGPNGFSSTDASLSNLEAGIYTLRIEDSSGFFIIEEWTVTQPDLLTISRDVVQNISCFQGNDGTIEVSISGGTEPYTYNWSTTDGSGIIAGTKNQNTLTAGTYSLEIVDANNCITQETVVLTEPDGLNITTSFKQDILCFGDATGAISIDVTGGTQIEVSPGVFDYNYSWSGPAGFTSTSKNITNIIAGTYTVAVTDNLGCTTASDIVVNESPEININFTKKDVSCYGEADGALDVIVSGGVAPYQISWNNFANGFSQSNLTAGTYIATITDGNNCVKEVAIDINQPIFFIDPVVQPISCNDANDGSVALNLTGGVAPIKVTWSDDPTAGVERNNLPAGTYTVTIVDSDPKQCPIEETFTFTNPPAIAVSSIVTDAIDCNIENSGSIDITVSGGTAPLEFAWSNGAITEDLEDIPQGDYSVTITDANGCEVNRQFSIFRQDPIEIEFIESYITDCDTKTITKKIEAKTSGGFLPHTLTWASGTVSGVNNEIMTTNQTGAYVLTVTDDSGCVQTKSILIDEIPTIGDPDFRYNAFALDNYAYLSVDDPIQFTNLSSGNFTKLTWNFGDDSLPVNDENPIHTYNTVGKYVVTLTAEYESGCTYTLTRTIDITIGYKLVNPTAFTPNGDGYNETIRPNFTGFTEIEMNIYNTWGVLVYFEKGTSLKGWNGFIKDTPAENGNYIMVVNGITFHNKNITTSTPVTLLK
ncbi:PKD domain-containing protein [Polaribacter sp. M15]